MLKLVISCLWVCAVTLGSAYAVIAMKTRHTEDAAVTKADRMNFDKTRSINIPIISNGAVQGYIIAQFSYTTKTEEGKKAGVMIDAFILDEAFKALYADDKLDFRHLEKYDVASLTKNLIAKVNARLDGDILKDVLVEEFNYIAKEDISK